MKSTLTFMTVLLVVLSFETPGSAQRVRVAIDDAAPLPYRTSLDHRGATALPDRSTASLSDFSRASVGDISTGSLSDFSSASVGDRAYQSLGDRVLNSLGDSASESFSDGVISASMEDAAVFEDYGLTASDPFIGRTAFNRVWLGGALRSAVIGCDQKGGGKGGKGCGCVGCFRRGCLSRSFVGLEYLHWYSKDRTFPPLVTTSPQGTPAADAGRLDPASPATILFGGGQMGGDLQSGGRLTLGVWLDDHRERSVGLRLYGNEGKDASFVASSTGNPILAIPFFDVNPLVGDEAAFIVAHPTVGRGSIGASAANDVFGGELFARFLLDRGRNYRLDLVGGYQFNRIDDELVMVSSVTTPQPITTTLIDTFDAHNEFHAGEIGLAADLHRGCWTVSLLGKIGIGNMIQTVAVDGNYSVVGGGSPGSGQGGLFAQPTNIGVFERDVTAFSPEAAAKLTYAVNDRLTVSVGYTFLYWTRVALAGDLIDRNVNSTQLTGGTLAGPARPALNITDTDYWVQTVDIGVGFSY